MNQDVLVELLESVRSGTVNIHDALARIRSLPFEDLGFAKVDLHRAVRHGSPEVIFCQGKTPTQVLEIVRTLRRHGQRVLATRAGREVYEKLEPEFPDLVYYEDARVIAGAELRDEEHGEGLVMVIAAGTSDRPVAEEAVLTARSCGSRVETIYDVGVAGLHRLLAYIDRVQQARALVVVAGMEGALPSVVGGLCRAPVIAVPTSVGYGASFGGLAALLGMLNSCSSNVTVVNIDNGFGAGYVASLINRNAVKGAHHA
jgi:NCAIR mutase (PurE)-related protein